MSGKIVDYKDLKVWQKDFEVVYDIIELVDMLPPGTASTIIGGQILGSSTSVCANIAEGYSSGTAREYRRVLRVAYRESKETDNWLQDIRESKKFAQREIVTRAQEIEVKNVEVTKMLSTLKKRLKQYFD